MNIVIIIVLSLMAILLIAPFIPVRDENGKWTILWDITDTTSDG